MSESDSHIDTYLLQILERLEKIEGRLSDIENTISRLSSTAKNNGDDSRAAGDTSDSSTSKKKPEADDSEEEEIIDAEPIEDEEPEKVSEDRNGRENPSHDSPKKPRIIIEDEPTEDESTATLEEDDEAKRREAEKLKRELFDLELDEKFRNLKNR